MSHDKSYQEAIGEWMDNNNVLAQALFDTAASRNISVSALLDEFDNLIAQEQYISIQLRQNKKRKDFDEL